MSGARPAESMVAWHAPSEAGLPGVTCRRRTSGLVSGMWALFSACTIAVVMNHLHTLTAVAKAPRGVRAGCSGLGST